MLGDQIEERLLIQERRDEGTACRRFCAALRYGETLLGKLRVRVTGQLADNSDECPAFQPLGPTDSGGAMDLATAMAVALFGMFAGSTVYFFYKLER
jgi:hypothetical protein